MTADGAGLSASRLEAIDKSITLLLHDAQKRAAGILHENRAILELLRDELLAKKSLDAKSLAAFLSGRGHSTAPAKADTV